MPKSRRRRMWRGIPTPGEGYPRSGVGGDETVRGGEDGGGGPAARARLGVDVLHVALHRADGEDEPIGDLLVGAAGGEQGEHLPLARAEAGGLSRGAAVPPPARPARRPEERARGARPPYLGAGLDVEGGGRVGVA